MNLHYMFSILLTAMVAVVLGATEAVDISEVAKVDSRAMGAANAGLVMGAVVQKEQDTKTELVTVFLTVTSSLPVVTVTEVASVCGSVGSSIATDTTPLTANPATTPATAPTPAPTFSGTSVESFASTAVIPPPSPAPSTSVQSTELSSTSASSIQPPTTASASPTPTSLPGGAPSTAASSNGDYLGIDVAVLMELMGMSIIFAAFFV